MSGPLTKLDEALSSLRAQATAAFIDPYADPASRISSAQFPGQSWDNSQRNALRHALWIGSTARALGASPDNPLRTPFAQGAAKLLGYVNELPTLAQLGNTAQIRDTLHDLNNNAVGLQVAGSAKTDNDFITQLIAKAMTARAGQPVNLVQPSRGQLSFDLDTPVSKYKVPPTR